MAGPSPWLKGCWLRGLGDNVAVLAPEGLRQVLGEQTAKAAKHYARRSLVGEDAVDESDQDPQAVMRAMERLTQSTPKVGLARLCFL